MPSQPYVRLNRGLMTPGITRRTRAGRQEAVGEQPSIWSHPDNSVYSAAPTHSSKKPGKCTGRAAGAAEPPRKAAIMSSSGRDKVPPAPVPPEVFYCWQYKEARLRVHVLFVRNPDNRGEQRKEIFQGNHLSASAT